MVAFLRAVRAEKRGRYVTPSPGGRSPTPLGGVAPPEGAAATLWVAKRPPHCWGARLRSSVFHPRVALNVDIIP